ncbi:MAG: hypothetical protein U5J64_01405 [Halobacteriales archaeon]|nr:hypothetical protein [Halobacteriales archaeon]
MTGRTSGYCGWRVALFAVLILVLALSMVSMGVAAQSTLTVDKNDSGNYDTVQAAVDNATSGDSIAVESGTYTGTVNITDTSDISIVGNGQGQTVIRPSGTVPWGDETLFPGRTTGVRVVSFQNIEFSELTLNFDQINDTAVTGLLYWESSGTLEDVTLREMSNPNDPVDLTSYFGTDNPGNSDFSPSNRAKIDIQDSRFVETGRIGVNAEDFTQINILRSQFSTTDAGYAVEIGSEATGSIRESHITGYNQFFSSGAESAAVYVENAFPAAGVDVTKRVDVVDNTITDSMYGVQFGQTFDGFGGDVDIVAEFRNNLIEDNTLGGVVITDEDASAGSSVSVTAEGNSILNNGGSGYSIITAGDGNVSLSGTNEVISGNDVGLTVDKTANGSKYSVSVTESEIAGNSQGVRNLVDGVVVDATLNWWGSSTGPSGVGSGDGDSVTDNVSFEPWLNAPPGEPECVKKRTLERGEDDRCYDGNTVRRGEPRGADSGSDNSRDSIPDRRDRGR